MNLIINASDAIGDRDGVIRVTTRCVKVGRKSSGGIPDRLADGDHLELAVSGTGCGMPSETQAKAFDPFFTTKSAGRGLGLAVVDGIVRALGAAILFTSQPDKGTTFHILLPGAGTTAGAARDAMSGVEVLAGQSRDATLLIVEDEDSIRKAVAKMLRETGFGVFEAAHGSSAIELLRANGDKIDVMLLDMALPGASSPEIVAVGRESPAGYKSDFDQRL